jgi:hypothetical protein
LELYETLRASFPADAVQDAIAALADAERRGEPLSLQLAMDIARKSAVKDRRAAGRVAVTGDEVDSIPSTTEHPPLQPRKKTAPNYPRGVLPARFKLGPPQPDGTPSEHIGLLTFEVADLPSPELTLAISEMFSRFLGPAFNGLPLPPEEHTAIFDAYERLFGHSIHFAWTRTLIEGVKEAKRRAIQQHANKTVSKRYAMTERISEGAHAMKAKDVLEVVRAATSEFPSSCRLPAWADDRELISFLIARMGFEGAGGPVALSEARLAQLLQDPHELATEIEEFGNRIAERLTDVAQDKAPEFAAPADDDSDVQPDGLWAAQKFTALAARIRDRAAAAGPVVAMPRGEHMKPPRYEPRAGKR